MHVKNGMGFSERVKKVNIFSRNIFYIEDDECAIVRQNMNSVPVLINGGR